MRMEAPGHGSVPLRALLGHQVRTAGERVLGSRWADKFNAC